MNERARAGGHSKPRDIDNSRLYNQNADAMKLIWRKEIRCPRCGRYFPADMYKEHALLSPCGKGSGQEPSKLARLASWQGLLSS
jgi:ribosomal protein S27AE